ncbi:MAG: hypothetical protein OYH77_05835 [Pseudomonadota bacterium]|nr:hypothetical protein [Pseudomonadota bacterium]
MKFFIRCALVALACSALVIGCGNEDENEDEETTKEAVATVVQ